MKRLIAAVLASVLVSFAYASSDSVRIVLNTGAMTRAELVSHDGGNVVVSQKGINYTFTEKSAQAIITDDGTYLIGKDVAEAKKEFDKQERERRKKESHRLINDDKYTTISIGYSISGMKGLAHNVNLLAKRTYRINQTSWYWDFGLGAGIYDIPHDVARPVVNPGSGYGMGGGMGAGMGAGMGTGIGTGGSSTPQEPQYDAEASDVIYAEIPVHISYHITRPKATWAPFFGLSGKYNFCDYRSSPYEESQLKLGNANRFQLSSSLGIEYLSAGNFSLGIVLGCDLTKFYKDMEMGFISAGFNLGMRF